MTHLDGFGGLAGWNEARLAFVFESEAFSVDLDNVGVVQQSIQQGGRESGIAGEGLIPLSERQVAGQHNGPFS